MLVVVRHMGLNLGKSKLNFFFFFAKISFSMKVKG